MKPMKFFSTLAVLAGIVVGAGGDYDYSKTKAPSTDAPVSNPPMLIVLGSDDNTSTEGMDWIVDYLATKKHADNTKLRMSFYSNTTKWNASDDALVVAHTKAYQAGHEVSAHTETHPYFIKGQSGADQIRMGLDEGRKEVQNNINDLNNLAGIKYEHMKGFRTPFLAYSDTTFQIMKEEGFTYDCSINGSVTWGQTSGSAYWPYTLDTDDGEGNYAPDNTAKYNWWNSAHDAPIRKHTGLWELPCNMWNADPIDTVGMDAAAGYETGGKITALDYNIWAQNKFDKEQSLRCLKYTLDQVYAGNRAPMTIGMHSQYYTAEKDDDAAFASVPTVADRKYVIEKFIDYALTKGNDVYFVSGAQAIAYCMNPVSKDSFNPDNYTWTLSDENKAPNGITLSNSSIKVGETTVGTLSAQDPNAGDSHTFSIVSGEFTISGTTLNAKDGLTEGDHAVKIKVTDQGDLSFEKDFTITITKEGGDVDTLTSPNVGGYCGWDKVQDEIGSDVTVTQDSTDGYLSGATSTIKRVAHTVGKDADGKDSVYYDAYASLNAYYDTTITFKDITALQLTYKSDVDFVCILPMKGVTDLSGTGHRVTLPKTDGEYKYVVVKDLKTELTQPSWADKVDLDLTKVSSLSFELADGSDGAIEGTISVQQVKMPGFPVEESILSGATLTTMDAIAVNAINQNALNLTVATNGVYEVAIYGTNGRMITKVNKNLIAGANSVSLGDLNISSSVVLVGITGNGRTAVSRMVIK